MAKKTNTYDYDLIVIGSGAGGSAAATIAANSGKRVAIIEASAFGGEAPNWGDIPTKALLKVAHIYSEAKNAGKFGIRSSMLGYNFPALQSWKELAIERTGSGGNRKYYESQGIHTIQGLAHFISPNEVSVNRRHISAEKFLIATGSHWEEPDITGLKSVKYHTPKTIMSLPRPPKSLFVIGGDSISVELSELYSTFGTKIFLSEKSSRILPKEDPEVGDIIQKILSSNNGVEVLTSSKVLSVHKEGTMKRVTYLRGGQEHSVKVNEVLITTDRQPTVDIGLENAGVDYTPAGIEVNEFLQTTNKHIFAAGDVLGREALTHSALLESRTAVHNMYHRNRITPDYKGTPRVTFTLPAVASVGLTEDDCRKRDIRCKVGVAPLSMIAKSNVSDFRDGFIKLICDQKKVVIGAVIVAPEAGEIIHELSLAVKYHMTAQELAETPHAFLTWSEAIRIAASKI